MLGIRSNPVGNIGPGLRLALELFLGVRRSAPAITQLDPKLHHLATRLSQHIREFSHQVKMMLKIHREAMITRQMLQARLSWIVMWIHAVVCTLSRADRSIRTGTNGESLTEELRIVEHVCDIADHEIRAAIRELYVNTDQTMLACAEVAAKQVATLPDSNYVIPEKTPDKSALGQGRVPDQTHIPQFGQGSTADQADHAEQSNDASPANMP